MLRYLLVVDRRAFTSAQAARAALDHTSLPPLPPTEPTPVFRVRFRGIGSLPLRYAAHLIAMLLVAAVVLWPSVQLPQPQADQPARLPARISAAHDDPQVLPLLPRAARQASDAQDEAPAPHEASALFSSAFLIHHRLREGEILRDVAVRYGVDVQSLFWLNNLQDATMLVASQDLLVPRFAGIVHTVQEGETIDAIARQFGVTRAAINLFPGNNLRGNEPLAPGREVFVPGGTLAYPEAVLERFGGEENIAGMRAIAAGIVREDGTSLREGPGKGYDRVGRLSAQRPLELLARHRDWVKVSTDGAQGWVRSDLLDLPDGAFDRLAETNDFPALPPRWVWPTNGSITSRFGWRSIPYRSYHDGVDIANRAGTGIYAARAGNVIEAGWCSGFGYCVKIDHGEDVVSIYGHLLKQPNVKTGQYVDAGDLIGLMGSTYDRRGGGYSTGVHLHFTVKVNGRAVDPMKFLP